MSLPNYYEILQVSPKADKEVIQAAYGRLAMKYHPDRNPDDPSAVRKMKVLNDAKETLLDPTRRQAYDRRREADRLADENRRKQAEEDLRRQEGENQRRKRAEEEVQWQADVTGTAANETLDESEAPGIRPAWHRKTFWRTICSSLAAMVAVSLIGIVASNAGKQSDSGSKLKHPSLGNNGKSPTPLVGPNSQAPPEVPLETPEINSPARVDFTNKLGMPFVRVPPGSFLMGTPAKEFNPDKDEQPQHRVRVSRPFLIGVFEVTQEQFQAVMGYNPSSYCVQHIGAKAIQAAIKEGTLRTSNTATHPVENISWSEAIAFCDKLSERENEKYRLPTEAEWEYACRAGTSTMFHFGDDINRLSQFAWTQSGFRRYTVAVGRFNPNPFGLYDTCGNVFEYCSDWYDPSFYAVSPTEDPAGSPSGLTRAMRGGSFRTYGNGSVNEHRGYKSAKRWQIAPNRKQDDVGFRVVLDAK